MEQRKLYDWLIVVFLHEIQNDLNYSDAMKEAIRQAGCNDRIAVFLIQDKVTTDQDAREFSFRLSVSRLEQTNTGNWSFIPIESPHLKIENKKKNCWETAFKYIYSHYAGERNMLMTFSEGAAFGINGDLGTHVIRPEVMTLPQGYIDLPVADPLLENMELEHMSRGGRRVSTNKYYVLDEEEMQQLQSDARFDLNGVVRKEGNVWLIEKEPNGDICRNLEILWISNLASALDRYLYGQYIDVLLMANCFMQVFANGFTLSNKVKFLVGAEGPMSMRGYDYGKLMDTLNKTPGIPSKSLVQQILADLKELYLRVGDDYAATTATIYANRLKFYPLALRVFEDLIAGLEPLLPVVAGKLAAIRGQMKNVSTYDNYPLVDAGLWIKLVTEQVRELEGADYYYQLFAELQAKIEVANMIDPIARYMDQAATQKYGYSGISLYFPADNKMHEDQEVLWCANFDSAIAAPFRTHSRWNIFLDKYFKALTQFQTQDK